MTNSEKTATLEKEHNTHNRLTVILPIDKIKGNTHVLAGTLENEINAYYGKSAKSIIEKLRASISGINRDSSKKSVVISIAPAFEKTIYLDVLLDEKLLFDEPFEIRDLVNTMHPADKYLLLVQSAEHFKIYLGDDKNLAKIKVHIPDNIAAYRNDIPEKIENFSDVQGRKEVMLDKFVHLIDKELENILNKYKLPVFVAGPERMNGHFKKFTHHEKAILDYIHGNYDEAKPHQLLQLIQPYLKVLSDLEKKELKLKIEQALNANKFSFGIDSVWANVMQKKGNMLLVERNFTYPAAITGNTISLGERIADKDPASVKDAVDVIINEVIESGGTVKFVDSDVMDDFRKIALFHYY